MPDTSHIQYFTHREIDKKKWDDCIDKAENGVIYACSFYLEHMSPGWDGLVLGDYEAVMPLTWKKKYGIHYLYQPFLTAQSGVFGKNITAHLVNDFIQALPAKFKLIEISLNSGNTFSNLPEFSILKKNYVLDLNKPYEELQQAYSDNIKRNIKKANQAGCTVQTDFAVEKVIGLALKQMSSYHKESNQNVERFSKLYQFLHARQMATTYGILNNQQELVASCVFFFSHNRAYYILVGNHPDGKTIGASHALIDAFIKDHAGKNMLLDFEGSDIPNLALFYSSFGAMEEKYPALRINRLPFYLKWMKRDSS
ncbi:MAG TPA: hypothetical protein VF487_01460 [Chitinophagaceae bacterium]